MCRCRQFSLFLPRDCSLARLHSAALAVVRCLAGWLSRSCTVSKRRNIRPLLLQNAKSKPYPSFEWYHFQWSWVTNKTTFQGFYDMTVERPFYDSWDSCYLSHRCTLLFYKLQASATTTASHEKSWRNSILVSTNSKTSTRYKQFRICRRTRISLTLLTLLSGAVA